MEWLSAGLQKIHPVGTAEVVRRSGTNVTGNPVDQTIGSDVCRFLGQLEIIQKHYKKAESDLQRALDINTRSVGDKNPMAVESLRALAHLYEEQSDWPKAEVYLLRAVKSAESLGSGMVTIPLWGLCDLYDRWDKPDKGQACWHRATDLMATQFGENSPNRTESMGSEAKCLRKLGRVNEAEKVEERIEKIHRTSE
jgi:uncharacterized protein HemY